MRPVGEWTEADLQWLVDNEIGESVSLEFKRSDALARSDGKIKEISKDISAFANSAGGTIVYGISESNSVAAGVDAGSDPAVINAEWLDQIISSNIKPRVQGVVIRPIPLGSGGMAFAIHIPQGQGLAPHQAKDYRYYKRSNARADPMEDYEVKDVMRRATHGEPYAFFRWVPAPAPLPGEHSGLLSIHLSNRTAEPVLYASVHYLIDARLDERAHSPAGFNIQRQLVATLGDQSYQVNQFDRTIMPPTHMPLFREQTWLSLDIHFRVPPANLYFFGYRITCPGHEVMVAGLVEINGYTARPVDADLADLFRE